LSEKEKSTMTTTVTLNELPGLVGQHLGYSSWLTVDQKRIDTFADATDDHQWIHVDPERAKDGPFGTTIAHGYLTLSLLIPLWSELLDVSGVTTKVNYGLNSVRFPAPVPAGSAIRLGATIAEITEIKGGVQLVVDASIEVEGGGKPVCVAQPVLRFYR
jgi:acyl dehydratase